MVPIDIGRKHTSKSSINWTFGRPFCAGESVIIPDVLGDYRADVPLVYRLAYRRDSF